jgi:ubiquinone/menaquinone biosynthesis C-methylase UbiE
MEKNPTQESAFLNGEANNWFNRNRKGLFSPEESIGVNSISAMLTPFKDEISKMLEIGCSDGSKLRSLCKNLDAMGFGIDPSSDAISAGNAVTDSTVQMNLTVGTANKLQFENSFFDVVYFGFSLYLIDRSALFLAISEADRVLKPGGFLVIQDFNPGIRHKRPYSHLDGIFSYKNSYAELFTSTGHYFEAEKTSFSHTKSSFDRDPNERISISLLYKETDPYPQISI